MNLRDRRSDRTADEPSPAPPRGGLEPRGRLILVALGGHKYEKLDVLDATPDTLNRVKGLFCGGDGWPGLGYSASAVPEDPLEDDLVAVIDRALDEVSFDGATDTLALWMSCHGDVSVGTFFLQWRNSDPDAGVSAAEIGELLGRRGIERAVVVADCCYSGPMGLEGMATAAATSLTKGAPASFGAGDRGLVFIAAARADEQGQPGGLIAAFEHAFKAQRLGAHLNEPLDPSRVVKAANNWFGGNGFQTAQIARIGDSPPVFPNPYAADIPAERDEIEQWWDPVSRGVPDFSIRAWRFRGRIRAQQQLVRWLENPTAGELCVITARAGSGKSALIARVSLLSRDVYRNLAAEGGHLRGLPDGVLPPVHGVDAFARASRGRTTARVLGEIARQLGTEEIGDDDAPLRHWLDERLREGGKPPVIAVDAVDEADDPAGLVEALMAYCEPSAPRARVLLASRMLYSEFDTARHLVLDLDDPELFDRADVLRYVTAILDEHSATWPDDELLNTPHRRRTLAGVIADRAGRSFLFARLLASSPTLRKRTERGDKLDLTGAINMDLGWRLADAPKDAEACARGVHLARRLLRPLAHARGIGFPIDDLWPQVVAALSDPKADGRPITAAWIENHLDHLRPYLTESADRRFVLNHALVIEHFAHPDASWVDTAIVSALAADSAEWLTPHPSPARIYARRHAAEHAAAAGLLDNLLAQPAFVLAADATGLLPVLGSARTRQGHATAGIVRRCAHHLTRGSKDLGDTAARLELHARREGEDEFAAATARLALAQPFSVASAICRPTGSSITLPGHNDAVTAVSLSHPRGGTPLAVTISDDETARVWNVLDGTSRPPLTGHSGRLTAVTTLELRDGSALAITASFDETARVWSLADGSLRAVLKGHAGPVVGVAALQLPEGTALALTASRDSTARVWDLSDGAERHVLDGHSGVVTAVAVTELPDGTPVAITASHDKSARVWDLRFGTQRHVLDGHRGGVTAVAVIMLPDGTPVAITASDDKTARTWDLRDGALRHILDGHNDWVTAVAVIMLPDGTPVAITASDDRTARTWDLRDGTQRHVLHGHDDWVAAVATTELPDGAPVGITASNDRSACVWDLRDGTQRATLTGHDDRLTGVAAMHLHDGTPLAITTSEDRSARVWDLRDGAPRTYAVGHTEPVTAVTSARMPDGSVLAVTASRDHTARTWRLDGRGTLDVLTGHDERVTAVCTIALPDGTPLAITASADHDARVWNLCDNSLRHLLRGHDDWVTMVTALQLADGTTIAITGSDDKRGRVWDLRDGSCRSILRAHGDLLTAVTAVHLADGTPVAVTTSRDCTARVWDLPEGTQRHTLSDHSGVVTAVATARLSRDLVVAVTASRDRTARVWDLRRGTLRSILDHPDEVTAVVTTELPDGIPLAITACRDGTARVWDLRDGSPRVAFRALRAVTSAHGHATGRRRSPGRCHRRRPDDARLGPRRPRKTTHLQSSLSMRSTFRRRRCVPVRTNSLSWQQRPGS